MDNDSTVKPSVPDISKTWEYTNSAFAQSFPTLNELATKNDPLGKDILSLYQEVTQKFNKIKIDSEEISKNIKDNTVNLKNKFDEYEKKISRSDSWMIGIVIFFCVTFVSTICLVFFDLIKEKDLYSNYNNVYKVLTDQTTNQELKIKDLENVIEVLKAKNYLK